MLSYYWDLIIILWWWNKSIIICFVESEKEEKHAVPDNHEIMSPIVFWGGQKKATRNVLSYLFV